MVGLSAALMSHRLENRLLLPCITCICQAPEMSKAEAMIFVLPACSCSGGENPMVPHLATSEEELKNVPACV
jgi:hypothetical protein